MRALALLAWRRGAHRPVEPDSVHTQAADGAIDEAIAVVGDPASEAAWARFGARPLDPHSRRSGPTPEERGFPTATARLGKEA